MKNKYPSKSKPNKQKLMKVSKKANIPKPPVRKGKKRKKKRLGGASKYVADSTRNRYEKIT